MQAAITLLTTCRLWNIGQAQNGEKEEQRKRTMATKAIAECKLLDTLSSCCVHETMMSCA